MKRSLVFLFKAVVPMLAALVFSAPAWSQLAGDSGQWEVVRAWYGSNKRSVDVTSRVRELARRDQRFQVDNEQFGSDPHPNVQKRLRIEARNARGETRSFDYWENSYVDGRMFAGWGSQGSQGGYRPPQHASGDWQVLSATYGSSRRRTNVTGRVQDLARRNERFRVSNDELGSDPDPGVEKTLWIEARGPRGERRTFSYREGQQVDGRMFAGSGYQGGQGAASGSGEWQVLRATYGASGRNVNVTGRVRDLARGDERFTVNNEQFGVDPYPNMRKTLRIDARGPGGATRSFEYGEGDIVDGRMFSGWADEGWDYRGSRSGDESGW